jgi:sulfate transport system permease protein
VVRASRPLRLLLRAVVVGYLFLLVIWPVWLVAQFTFEDGLTALTDAFADAQVLHALQLTAVITVISVAINLVFGVTMSLLIVRVPFPGRRLLSALLDVPLSVSPVVVGLALLLVYNPRDGWFGPALADAGIKVIFSTPGMVMATTFVALPLVIREVVPVLQEIGDDQEWAARSLGANSWQTLRRITLPSIKWAVVYGVVLALARALGEFGAVKVVSGSIVGKTQTATLIVEERFGEFDKPTAYAVSFVLVVAAVVCIVVANILRRRSGAHTVPAPGA